MAMVIMHNMAASEALHTLNKNASKLAKDLKKVASGRKIGGAGDDASAYAISERMRVQIRGLDQAKANAQNANSLMRTAEGAVQSTIDVLRTIKEKALDAASDHNSDADRATIQREIDQQIDQVDENASIQFNGRYLFDGSADRADTAQDTIIKALHTEWIPNSLSLIEQSYGIRFNEANTKPKEMDVILKHEAAGSAQADALAYVSSSYVGSHTTGLTLTVNLNYYDSSTAKLDTTNVNGKSSSASAIYLDRVLAHELTHAVMSANIDDFADMPLYIVEGMAELTQGADDTRTQTLRSMDAAAYQGLFANGSGTDTQQPYAGGFAFLRYVEKKGGEGSMARFMTALMNGGGKSLETAISAAVPGATLKELQDAFVADRGAYANADAFYKECCGIDLNNADTGAATGYDAGGSREQKTSEDIVPEGGSAAFWYFPDSDTTMYDGGLIVHWPTFSRHTSLTFQLGTRANQNIGVALSDIHARAMGLEGDDGVKLSVKTVDQAKTSLTLIDNSLRKALDQITTIGAIESRLGMTADNLITSSQNTQASESTIRDADMAKEMTSYTKHNILLQAAQSMLAQANQSGSSILSLLQ